MKQKIALIIAIILLGVFASGSLAAFLNAKEERDRARRNVEALAGDVLQYKVRDSLNAARVESLELTVKEFERFRADDAAIIQELKLKNRDLSAVNREQSQTIIELKATPRDTVVIRDSVQVPAVAVHCGDAWYDFDGILTKNEFSGKLANRDTLMLVESVKYKRFLCIFWKTKKVRDRQLDVLSLNPHTTIQDIQHILIQN